MEDITIALYDDAGCGVSPLMPYVDTRFNGKHFTRTAKYMLGAALLRCGIDVIDANADSRAEPVHDFIMRMGKSSVDACIVLTYSSFGSRKSFNDVSGRTVGCPAGRFAARSRIFCEDVCAKLKLSGGAVTLVSDDSYAAANCPTAVVSGGYVTCFDDAKLIYDRDYAERTAEYTALAVCEFFDVPYIVRDDINAYPMLCMTRRGKKVKMLQCLLNLYGNSLGADGVYGQATDRAVRRLCIGNGRNEKDGVTAALWRDLTGGCDRPLTIGSTDSGVFYLQNKLYSKLYRTKTDGVLGKDTLSALAEYVCDCTGNDAEFADNEVIDGDTIKLVRPIGGGRARLF